MNLALKKGMNFILSEFFVVLENFFLNFGNCFVEGRRVFREDLIQTFKDGSFEGK